MLLPLKVLLSALSVAKTVFKLMLAEKHATSVYGRDFANYRIIHQASYLASIMNPDLPASNDSRFAKGWRWLYQSWSIVKQLLLALLVLGLLYLNVLLLLLLGG